MAHSAAVMGRDGAFFVIGAAYDVCDRLELIRADMGYRGSGLEARVEPESGWRMEIVKRPLKWGRDPVDVEPEPMRRRPALKAPYGVPSRQRAGLRR